MSGSASATFDLSCGYQFLPVSKDRAVPSTLWMMRPLISALAKSGRSENFFSAGVLGASAGPRGVGLEATCSGGEAGGTQATDGVGAEALRPRYRHRHV